MAHEMEPVPDVVPDVVPDQYPGVEPPWFASPVLTERPEWTELRPPFHPDSKLERNWSNVMTPLRGMALGFLWLTYSWIRFAVVAGIVLLLITLFYAR